MSENTGSTNISCTIPVELSKQLILLADIEERSKSYYVKKALEKYLEERLEDALLAKIGDEAYEEFVKSGEKAIPYDDIRKELKLDN